MGTQQQTIRMTRSMGGTMRTDPVGRRQRRRAVLSTAVAATTAAALGGSGVRPARADTFNYVNNNSSFAYGDPSSWQDISNASNSSVIPGAADIAQIVNGSTDGPVYIGGGQDVTSNPTYSVTELWAGNIYGTDNYGNAIQQGGTMNVSSWFVVGRFGGVGEYDLQAGTVNSAGNQAQLVGSLGQSESAILRINGTSVFNATAAGNTYDTTNDGSLVVGDGLTGSGTGGGHLYLSDSAIINSAKAVYVGAGSGAVGILDMSGTTAMNSSGLKVGTYSSTGTLNLTGGTITNSGETWVGDDSGTGTMSITSGGTLTANDWFIVGRQGGTGVLNLSGTASITKSATNPFYLAFSYSTGGANGLVNQSGGTITSAAGLGMASSGADVATYNLSGGTLTVPQIYRGAGTATFNFDGGTLRAYNGANAAFLTGLTTANVTANGAKIDANGQSFTIGQGLLTAVTGGTDGGLTLLNSGAAASTVTLTGTSTYTGATVIPANVSLQLGNGTAAGDGVLAGTSGVTDNGTFGFNRSGAKTASYVISGPGGVTMAGTGTQALSNASTYTGATTINAGTLALIGTGALSGTSGISVATGGKFLQLSSVASNRPLTLAGGGTVDGTGTVGATTVAAGGIVYNGNGSTGTLSLASLLYQGSATDNLNVANNLSTGLTVAGAMNFSTASPVTLNLLNNGGKFAIGTYELVKYGGSNVLTNANVNTYFTVGTGLTGRQTGTLSVAGGYLDLIVAGSSGSGYDRWTGSVNNSWDTATNNWSDVVNGGPVSFATGDSVTFDNTGSNTNPINIAGATVVPATLDFNNSTAVAYTISSTGGYGIGNYSANTRLNVNGTGTVTINTSNSYAGGTFINNGTLVANGPYALGAGPVNLIGGQLQVGDPAGLGSGTLNISGGTLNTASGTAVTVTTNNPVNFNGNLSWGGGSTLNLGAGAVALNLTPTITVSGTSPLILGGIVGGTNGLTVNGSGGAMLTLTGINTFTGAVTVNGGTLYAAAPNAGTSGALRAASSITVNNGGTLLTGENGLFGSAVGTNERPITLNAGGTLNSSSATATSHMGLITLAGGNLAYPGTPTGDGLTYGSYDLDLGVNAGGTATTSVISAAGIAPTQTGGTIFNVASGTTPTGIDLDVTGSLVSPTGLTSTALVKTGAGTLRLSGASNTYTGGTNVSAGLLTVSGSAGTGPLQISGGAMNVSAGAAINLTSTANSDVGYLGTNGTLNVLGGTLASSGELRVGGSNTSGVYTGTGYLNVSGGTVSLASLTLARGNNYQNVESGYMNLTGGTVTSAGDVIVGFAGAGTGSLNVAGGTLNVGTTATKWLQVGEYDTTQAVVTVSAGAVNLNTNTCIRFSTGGNAGGNVFNQLGGSVTFYADNGVTVGGTGVLDMQEGTSTNPGIANTYNLYGGVLTVPQIISTQTTGTRTFNFSGGTLRAGGNSAAFMAAGVASTANVQAGGAVIDSNGYAVTVGQVLSHDATGATLDGGLSKLGAGTLALAGSNTYTGPTSITAGTLALSGTGSINATSAITVNGAGAKFLNLGTVASTPNVTLTNGTVGGTGTVGATTVANSAANVIANGNISTGVLTLNALTYLGAGSANLTLTSGSTIGAINVSGGLATNSSVSTVGLNLLLSGGFVTGSTYDLIDYGSLLNNGATATTPAGFTILSGLSGRQSGALSLVSTGATSGYLALTVSGSAGNTYWSGVNSNLWQTGTTGNWKNQSDNSSTDFFTGDNVTFDDRGAKTNPVSISAANVNPASVTFNNSTATYNFSGGYGITGIGSVTKNGTAPVYLFTSNSYTGGTTINAGTVVINSAASLGDPSGAATLNAATLEAAANINSTRAIALGSAASGITVDSGSAYNVSGVVSGTGTLNKAGAGTLVLATSNSFTGGTVINAGAISIAADNQLGPTGTAVTLNGGTLTTTNANGLLSDSHPITVNASGGTININSTGSGGNGQLYIATANLLLGTGPLTLTGNGTVTTTGAGNLRIGATNSYAGAVTINGGGSFEYGVASAVAAGSTFTVGNQGELITNSGVTFPNAVTVTGGTNSILSFENGTTGVISGPVTLNASAIIGLRDWYNNATVRSGTISGVISGVGGLTTSPGTATTGAPVLYLTAPNTYTGPTTIAANTVLQLGTAGATGSLNGSSGITDNGQLVFYRTVPFVQGTDFGGQAINGTGSVFVDYGTTVTFNTANGYTGGTTVGGGNQATAVLVATASGAAGTGPISILGNGSANALQVSSGSTLSNAINLSAKTAANTGAGIESLSGANTLSGTVTFQSGGSFYNVQSDAGSTLTFSAATAFTGGATTGTRTLDFAGAGNTVVTGVIANGSATVPVVQAGTGTLTLSAPNTYTGGTTVSAGTLRANNATQSLGTGLTTVSTTGVLAGNGATGGAVTIAGGTVTAGTGATTADSVGTLTATSMNWSSGTFTDKFVAATGAGVGNDLLVVSSLTLPTAPGGFTVNVQTATGSAPAIAGGSYIVLAVDKDATTANPFNASSSAYVSAFGNLTLQVNGTAPTAGYAFGTQADSTGNGGFDLILSSTAAAPEPTSLLLAGATAAPLLVGRRRRRQAARA
jgi:autotransporter-associated beta strand protein